MKKKIFFGVIAAAFVIAIIYGINDSHNTTLKNLKNEKTIAVVRIEGEITGGSQDSVFGNTASSEKIMQNLREAANNPQTAAIVLRINSPGGSAPAAQEIGEEIKKIHAQNKIPIITSMGDVTASGGYWIASCTDKIIANPATMTGSIGVIMETSSWVDLYKKIGIKNNSIKSGPHKDMGSTARELTPEEQAILQNMVNDIFEQFVTIVSTGRHIPADQVRKLADGRIFTGRQAKDLKLVDALGNYYDALDEAQKLAGITGEPNVKEFGVASPWDIFKTRMEIPAEQEALVKFASQLLQVTEVKN